MITPKISIICCVIYSVNIAVRTKFFFYDAIPLLFLILINLKDCRVLIKTLIRLIKLNGFIVFVAGGIYLFHRDLKLALLILLRSNLILSFNLFLFCKYSPFDVYRGIIPLPIPKKLKLIFLFFIKFIEILQREYEKLQEALKIRGFKPKTNLFTYKSYAYIIGNMLAKTLKKSKNIYNAITMRGFRGGIFSFEKNSLNFLDVILLFLTLSHLCFAIFINLKKV